MTSHNLDNFEPLPPIFTLLVLKLWYWLWLWRHTWMTPCHYSKWDQIFHVSYNVKYIIYQYICTCIKEMCFLLLKFLDTEKELSKSKIVTVCHGDVWSNNMLFTEDDESVTLIDFQMLGRVHPALDLWYFLAVNSDKVSCRAGSNIPWRKKGAYF